MEVILDDGLQCPCVTTEMAKSACGVYNSTESTELCVSHQLLVQRSVHDCSGSGLISSGFPG